MNDLFKDLIEYEGIIKKILPLLPEDPAAGLTILSMCIDKYSYDKGLDSDGCWDHCYEIAKQVHAELGSYGKMCDAFDLEDET